MATDKSFDSYSVGASTLSNWSASFRVRFPWLHKTNQPEEDVESSLAELYEEKLDEILDCLNGVDEQVDLWQLRNLAISRGGLVSSSIRKRAWPKLMGAHEHVLMHKKNRGSEFVSVSRKDMQLLKKDVALSVWHIEEHVLASRQKLLRQEQQEQDRPKKVSFLPGLLTVSSRDDTKSNPPMNSVTLEDDVQSNLSGGTYSPALSSQGTVDTFADSVTPRRLSSAHEQKVLSNILSSILQTPMEDSPYFEDDRLHYYRGLHDLAALMLINLESPSLTTLVMGRLASFHLRDAMRHTTAPLETALVLTVFPLLQQVDAELYAHITSSIEMPSFCVSWIQCWFSQQVTDVRVASRIVDLFLVGHALMPIYFCVAMLTFPMNRDKILATEKDMKTMHSVLRRIPVELMKEAIEEGEQELSEMVEAMIETSITYMQQVPPPKLLEVAKSNPKLKGFVASAPSIAMLQSTPEWATKSYAPTDWALLQQAKAMRSASAKKGSVTTAVTEPKEAAFPCKYPTAAIVAGLEKDGAKSRAKGRISRLLLLVFIALLSLLGGWVGFQVYGPGMLKGVGPTPAVLQQQGSKLQHAKKQTSAPLRSPRGQIKKATDAKHHRGQDSMAMTMLSEAHSRVMDKMPVVSHVKRESAMPAVMTMPGKTMSARKPNMENPEIKSPTPVNKSVKTQSPAPAQRNQVKSRPADEAVKKPKKPMRVIKKIARQFGKIKNIFKHKEEKKVEAAKRNLFSKLSMVFQGDKAETPQVKKGRKFPFAPKREK